MGEEEYEVVEHDDDIDILIPTLRGRGRGTRPSTNNYTEPTQQEYTGTLHGNRQGEYSEVSRLSSTSRSIGLA